jgi:uncharacterized membrane protein
MKLLIKIITLGGLAFSAISLYDYTIFGRPHGTLREIYVDNRTATTEQAVLTVLYFALIVLTCYLAYRFFRKPLQVFVS